MQETRVQSLGQEDPLEKEMATHSSIHAWKIPWTEEPGGLLSMGSQRVRHDFTFTFIYKLTSKILPRDKDKPRHIYTDTMQDLASFSKLSHELDITI